MARVLIEGTLRYVGARDGGWDARWMTARVFVLEYESRSDGTATVTVVAREPIYLPGHRVPSMVGSIHTLPATDGGSYGEHGIVPIEELLTLDMETLVPDK